MTAQEQQEKTLDPNRRMTLVIATGMKEIKPFTDYDQFFDINECVLVFVEHDCGKEVSKEDVTLAMENGEVGELVGKLALPILKLVNLFNSVRCPEGKKNEEGKELET